MLPLIRSMMGGNYQHNKNCKTRILSPSLCTWFGCVFGGGGVWICFKPVDLCFFGGTILAFIVQDHTGPLYFCGIIADTSIGFHQGSKNNCLPWKLKIKIKRELWVPERLSWLQCRTLDFGSGLCFGGGACLRSSLSLSFWPSPPY